MREKAMPGGKKFQKIHVIVSGTGTNSFFLCSSADTVRGDSLLSCLEIRTEQNMCFLPIDFFHGVECGIYGRCAV